MAGQVSWRGHRFRREQKKGVAGVMPAQVTETVYAVGRHEVGDRLITHGRDFTPAIRAAEQPFGRGIAIRKIVVAENLEFAAIVSGEYRLEKLPYRMVPEVARNIA